MDRKLVLDVHVAIPAGHRIEVHEQVDDVTGEVTTLDVLDLDTRVRYHRAAHTVGELFRWSGRVIECTVRVGAANGGAKTVISVDAEPAAALEPGAGSAAAALQGADEAAEAAKSEADRWGGADRVRDPEPERFW